MKLSALLILLALFKIQANTYAQKQKVSLDLTDASVAEIFEAIEAQSDFSFFYKTEEIDAARRMDLKVEQVKIKDVLDLMFPDEVLEYDIIKKQVLIKGVRPKPKSILDYIWPSADDFQALVKGVVRDDKGVPLSGVTVHVKGSSSGVITDFNGAYEIEAQSGDVLVFSFLGFKTIEKSVGSSKTLNVGMEEDAAELDEVVLTGYRASFAKASKIKREANQVVDAISAEDMGKMPDPNIADALQRVTGVQLTRQDNEGREVSVRGLSSFFTKITVNGSGIGPGAAADDSDGLDVGLLGADLATSLEVYKSPTAKQIEGGVGGTVNIVTAKPLELEKETVITGRLRANYESLEGSVTPDGSVQLGHIFNDKFGVILGFQGGKRKYRRDAYHDDRSGGYRDTDLGQDGQEFLYPEKSRSRYNERENDQATFNLALQYQPTEQLNLYFNGTLSKKKKFRQFSQNEIQWRRMMDDVLVPGSAVVDENNTIVEAQFSDISLLSRSSVREDTEELKLFGFGADYQFSDRLKGSLGLSYSQNTVEEITKGDARIESRLNGLLGPGETFGYRLSGGDAGFTLINPTNFDINDPDIYDVNNPDNRVSFSAGGSFDLYDHKQTAAQTDFTYDWNQGIFKELEFGARYLDRDEDRNRPGQIFTGEFSDVSSVFDNLRNSPSDYGEKLEIAGFGPFLYPDSYAAYELAQSKGLIESAADRTDRLFEDNYNTSFDSWAAYVQSNLRGTMFGKPFRGNIGVRVVGTDFESTGVSVVNDRDFDSELFERAIITAGNQYTEILPSFNIALELSDKFLTRVALARVMKRPAPEDTRAAFNVNDVEFDDTGEIVSEGPYNAFNGNPELDPFMANQVDVSFEYYNNSGSVFSAGVFFKDVKDLTAFDSNEEVVQVEILNPITLEPEVVDAILTSPINADGTIKGFELSASQFFSFLPSPFDGLGMQANFTYTDAKDENDNVIGGTSEKVYNAIAFYEKYGFGIRFAYNFRDAFNESPNRGINGRWTDANQRFDLSAFYEITKNLSFTIEGINITNEGNRSYLDGIPNRLNQYEINGTRWLAGLRFKF
ncbi:TonB-dependent receptor [Sediminicola luteus]|nr:TonB-dependent receptor [Sediminicola luteus]